MTWATPVPILVFLGLSVLDLGPMYVTDRRQTDRRQTSVVRQKHRLMSPPIRGRGIIRFILYLRNHYNQQIAIKLMMTMMTISNVFRDHAVPRKIFPAAHHQTRYATTGQQLLALTDGSDKKNYFNHGMG